MLFYFKFHWNVFPRVQLTINLHWFRSLFHRQQATVWTNDGQVYWHSYMLLGLNESIHWYNGHSYVKPIFKSYNHLVNIWWSLISNGKVQLLLWCLINQFLWYFRVSSHSNNNIWLVTSPPWNPGPYDNMNHPSEVHLKLKYHKISFAFIIHFSSIQIPQTLGAEHGGVTAVLCTKFEKDLWSKVEAMSKNNFLWGLSLRWICSALLHH